MEVVKSQIKMKIFQSIQKSFSILGIGRSQHKFNHRILVTSLMFCLATGFNSKLLFDGIKGDFKEYANIIFVVSAAMLLNVCFSNLVFKMEKLFGLIDLFEKTVNESKLKMQLIALKCVAVKN